MLIRKPNVTIISRKVTLATGEVVLAFFAIVETEGFREIKFLGTKPVQASQDTSQNQVLLLENKTPCAFSQCFEALYTETVSPFCTLDFLTSQPARAPSGR